MKKGGLGGRSSELEEKFFRQRDMELLKALREETATKERKKALSDASGIACDDLLDRLVELDLCSETAAAMSLIPLICVAWADGAIDAKERDAVLAAAEQQGLKADQPSGQMLQRWLDKRPDPKLLTAWKGYVATLSQSLDEPGTKTLKEEILGRARVVAEAAGGLLGFGNKVSTPEQAVLDELEQAFD